jgi:hypothetical protein
MSGDKSSTSLGRKWVFRAILCLAKSRRRSDPRTQREGTLMKYALNILGLIFVLMGGVWFLQGINILPGSFMTGQIRWAIYGGMAVAAGLVLLVVANRRRAKS